MPDGTTLTSVAMPFGGRPAHKVPRNLAGRVFSQWTVLRLGRPTGSGGYYWLCRCACGVEREVRARGLITGRSGSCGHGHRQTKSRLHRIWVAMRLRCRSHPNYGGRGISICDEWDTFERFAEWARGAGYSDTLTIERVDVNGNYEPANCTWIPPGEQASNTRRVRRSPTGELWCRIAERNGVPAALYRNRASHGWDDLRAATQPVGPFGRRRAKS